jgi:hypothetical protein
MLQLPLFDDLNPAPARAATVLDSASTAPVAPEACEGWLFDSTVILRLALDEALEDGRFEDARRAYDTLLEQWEPGRSLAGVAFLGRLDVQACNGPLDSALRQWRDIVPLTGPAAADGRRAWRGLARRLLPVHAAGVMVATEPRCLAPLVNALFELSREAPAFAAQARDLVRDALLDGRDLRPDDFGDDRVRDLLSEPLAPGWLASLGAIRRLWSAPAVDEAAAEGLLAVQVGAIVAEMDDIAAARHFWACLRTAWSQVPEVLRQEARRRMKRLDPDLHRLAMQRGIPPIP